MKNLQNTLDYENAGKKLNSFSPHHFKSTIGKIKRDYNFFLIHFSRLFYFSAIEACSDQNAVKNH